MDLTLKQLEAINHKSGRLRVIACPGSGKTEVIARRVSRLIENGEAPEGIVAITFTEKAAEELKTRIRAILQKDCPERSDFGDMFIGTIHAFSLDLLRDLDPYFRTFDVLDSARRVAYVSKSGNYYGRIKLRRLEISHGLHYYQVISRFLRSVDIMLMEQVEPEDLEDVDFKECFTAYKESLEEDRYFDFATIIHTIVSRLKASPEELALIAHRVKHIIVDEFQDVDKLQSSLIELLSPAAESICVVGDDDQGIYHWRGTDVSIMREFCGKGSPKRKCQDIPLNINFRSTAALVDLSRKFIEKNGERLAKEMVENAKLKRKFEKGDIQCGQFDTEEEELDFMVSRINELHGADFVDRSNRPFSLTFGDFAILTRTNEWAAKVIDRLDRDGIPSIAYSGDSIFERPEVEFTLDCIAYVFNCERYYRGGGKHIPLLQDIVDKYGEIFRRENFPTASKNMFSNEIGMLESEVKTILAKGKKDYLGELGLQGYFHRILETMGASRFDFGEVYNYNLACLSRAVSDYESVWIRLRASEVKWFFTFMTAYGKSVYTDPQHQDPTVINAIRILTIHKAKGLEFPVVFVPNFVSTSHRNAEKCFVNDGLYDVQRYSGTDEDERRVYYTAFTRSEKYLFISGASNAEGRVRSRRPHQFLKELDAKYISEPQVLSKSKSGYPNRLQVEGKYSTSYSELTSYLRCPTDFLLRSVFGYNAGVPAGFGYGTNIHNVLNMIHRDFIRFGKGPDESQISDIMDRMFHLRYATSSMSDNMKEAAKKVVQRYVSEHSRDFNRILETEKRFEFVLGEALIAGQIDLLKRVDGDGTLRSVEIIDFKTEKADGAYSADYERQLRYYALACLTSLNYKPERALVHHLDDGTTSSVDISDPQLNKTRVEVKNTVEQILMKQFPAAAKRSRCEECDYRRLCSYRAS